MKLLALLSLILGVGIITLSKTHAAQTAVVSSPKAIIYADRNLTSPIGFIRNGRRIQVGEVKRKRGTILPIIVSGRVAYIQIKDIALSRFGEDKDKGPRNPRITEHDIDEMFEQTEDKLNKNNFFILDIGQVGLGSQWQELENEFGTTQNQSALSLKLLFEHRPPLKKHHWGLGLGYYSLGQENLSFKALTIEGFAHWVPLNFRYVSFALKGGLIASGAMSISASSLNSFNIPTGNLVKDSGYLLGYQAGVQANILPYSQIGFILGASLKSLILSGLDPISVPSGGTVDVSGFSGINLHAGLSYKF